MTDDGRGTGADWVDLGPLDGFPEGAPVLRKHGAKRFACVRLGGALHALDDRCPHQGYPLSQGEVRGGVLTCAWHNWKFELKTGECTFGGEPVKSYPVRVDLGRVHLDCAVDPAAERPRLIAGVRTALAEDDTGRGLREALRLGDIAQAANGPLGRIEPGLALVAEYGAAHAEYGFDHGLAVLADLASWAERGWIQGEEAYALAAHAVAEPSKRYPARAVPDEAALEHPGDAARLVDALIAERREEAEARARFIARHDGADAAAAALLPFVARHLYDYGHGAIFLSKARELAARFDGARHLVIGASALELAWATAETSLPPFAATRGALERIDASRAEPREAEWDRAALEQQVLEGERSAVEATVARLEEGAAPVALLRAIGHAAAVRLLRFDAAWERRLDAEVSVLDVTHAVTFVEAVLALSPLATPRDLARLAVLAAGFVGKLRHGDAPGGGPSPDAHEGASLDAALLRRDVAGALAAVRGLDAAGRAGTYRAIAPFCALDAAVRPIFYAHCVKVAEALRRLDAADSSSGPDGSVYLDALVGFVAPARPENRARRTAFVAKKFLADGRPPEGLY